MEGGNIRGGNASRDEIDRLRASALQSERLLESRESSYRQQIMRLESQVNHLHIHWHTMKLTSKITKPVK